MLKSRLWSREERVFGITANAEAAKELVATDAIAGNSKTGVDEMDWSIIMDYGNDGNYGDQQDMSMNSRAGPRSPWLKYRWNQQDMSMNRQPSTVRVELKRKNRKEKIEEKIKMVLQKGEIYLQQQ